MSQRNKSKTDINRRDLLQRFTLGSVGLVGLANAWGGGARAAGKKPCFLIVIGCNGGASMLDSFLALSESEVRAAGGDPSRLNCFPDAQVKRVSGSPLRALDLDTTIAALGNQPVKGEQSAFLQAHGKEMLVATIESTSVNHAVAQQRSVTGNDAWSGRTLMECVAAEYGQSMALANLSLSPGGFSNPGIDAALPSHARPTRVVDPTFFALGLDSRRGLAGLPPADAVDLARALRDKDLEAGSRFFKTFKDSPAIGRWLELRSKRMSEFEKLSLASRLYFGEQSAAGLSASPEAAAAVEAFPDFGTDPLEAQAVLAYLALTAGTTAAVTIGPNTGIVIGAGGLGSIINPPIAFDFAHSDHRGVQALMWTRVLRVVDKLIALLKGKELDPATGESYWDRSLIYFATDFGRDKTRPSNATSFGTGHHLNNGNLIVSPLVSGNKILGGVDAKTGMTYGFDLASGAAAPQRKTSEKEMFSGILQALGVDTSAAKLPDVKAMRKVG